MPDLNDYHAFKSTSGGGDGRGFDFGCLKTVIVIGAIALLLVLLGQCEA